MPLAGACKVGLNVRNGCDGRGDGVLQPCLVQCTAHALMHRDIDDQEEQFDYDDA